MQPAKTPSLQWQDPGEKHQDLPWPWQRCLCGAMVQGPAQAPGSGPGWETGACVPAGGGSPSAIPRRFLLVLPWVWDASLGTASCPICHGAPTRLAGLWVEGQPPAIARSEKPPAIPAMGAPACPTASAWALLSAGGSGRGPSASPPPPPGTRPPALLPLQPLPSSRRSHHPRHLCPWGRVGGNGQLSRGGRAVARGVPSPPAWPSSPAASQHDSLSRRHPRSKALNWFG